MNEIVTVKVDLKESPEIVPCRLLSAIVNYVGDFEVCLIPLSTIVEDMFIASISSKAWYALLSVARGLDEPLLGSTIALNINTSQIVGIMSAAEGEVELTSTMND